MFGSIKTCHVRGELTGVESLTLFESLGFSPKIIIDLHNRKKKKEVLGALILNRVSEKAEKNTTD